jgi:hypothetical protein
VIAAAHRAATAPALAPRTVPSDRGWASRMGRVWSPAPAVKVVTKISSKERAKARRPPASWAERRAG